MNQPYRMENALVFERPLKFVASYAIQFPDEFIIGISQDLTEGEKHAHIRRHLDNPPKEAKYTPYAMETLFEIAAGLVADPEMKQVFEQMKASVGTMRSLKQSCDLCGKPGEGSSPHSLCMDAEAAWSDQSIGGIQ